MAPTSTYYFDANATSGREFFRGIPMFAVHAGFGREQGWDSARVTSKAGFEDLVSRINVQVPVYIALPMTFAGRYFTKGRNYTKVAIYAFKYMRGQSWHSDGGYMVGATIALVLKDVTVVDVVPVPGFKGLPIPPQVQKNYLEKTIGTATYSAAAVTLGVVGECDVVE
jgi:hypothetical protein